MLSQPAERAVIAPSAWLFLKRISRTKPHQRAMRTAKFKFSLQYLLGFREHFTGSVSGDPQGLLIHAKLDFNASVGGKNQDTGRPRRTF